MLLCVIGVRIRRKAIFAKENTIQTLPNLGRIVVVSLAIPTNSPFNCFQFYVRDERKSKCIILASNSECFFTEQLFQIQKYFPKLYLRNVQVSYIRIYAYMKDVYNLCNSSRCMQQCKLFIIHVVYSLYSA